jgi:hypothetical protein
MSGRKQHFIPQFILREFGVSVKKRGAQVHVFKKGSKPFLTSTENIAAGRDFYYSEAIDYSLVNVNDNITKYENRLKSIYTELVLGNLGVVLDGQICAELITHLCIRTSNLRDSMRNVAQELWDTVADTIVTEKGMLNILGVGEKPDSTIFDDAVNKEYSENPIWRKNNI